MTLAINKAMLTNLSAFIKRSRQKKKRNVIHGWTLPNFFTDITLKDLKSNAHFKCIYFSSRKLKKISFPLVRARD